MWESNNAEYTADLFAGYMTIKKPHLQDFRQFDLDRKLTSVTCTHNKSVCLFFLSSAVAAVSKGIH